ncbi:hypothetical protein [Bacillus mycoides]|uniref:hypothetical protein n=1 Tax=Bacillus mycoides TaxID=1405 RepID=UPI0012FEFE2D|nr:hypothetical protein [Bacillus mycoides]
MQEVLTFLFDNLHSPMSFVIIFMVCTEFGFSVKRVNGKIDFEITVNYRFRK